MTALRRRAILLVPIVAIALACAAVACGPSAPATPKPSSSSEPSAGASPRLTPVPGGPSPVVGATVGPPTTTDTEFGPIFDSLPASFPTLPGQEPTESDTGPASGSFAVNLSAAAASDAMKTALVAGGWSVDVGSPLEDGSIVLEATGAGACKTEVRFTPLSGTVVMSVLYGASCPFG